MRYVANIFVAVAMTFAMPVTYASSEADDFLRAWTVEAVSPELEREILKYSTFRIVKSSDAGRSTFRLMNINGFSGDAWSDAVFELGENGTLISTVVLQGCAHEVELTYEKGYGLSGYMRHRDSCSSSKSMDHEARFHRSGAGAAKWHDGMWHATD